MKADAMLARFQLAGGKVRWASLTDTKVVGEFTHESGGSATIEWDMDRAKAAGLGGKANWLKYPRQMLRARVISEGIRTVYPACVVGVYTPEEVQDFEQPRQAVYEAVPATIKPSPITPVLEAAVEEVTAVEDIGGLLEAIEACTTETALKVVSDQIKKRSVKGTARKQLQDAYVAKKAALIEQANEAAAAEVEQ